MFKEFDLNLMNLLQGTRETLRRHVQDFGDLLCKENDVGLIIDGQVSDLWPQYQAPVGPVLCNYYRNASCWLFTCTSCCFVCSVVIFIYLCSLSILQNNEITNLNLKKWNNGMHCSITFKDVGPVWINIIAVIFCVKISIAFI